MMRKIEREMNEALNRIIKMNSYLDGKPYWRKDNTAVERRVNGDVEVFLHGNKIARYSHQLGELIPVHDTFIQYTTMTTASRLRALGFDAQIKDGWPYIDGKPLLVDEVI